MDNISSVKVHENGNVTSSRKSLPYASKDMKRKLTFMNKKIFDLHRQRKFAYKNSVKVKRMVHNQVNQIVKCLRTRERCLWADVDEAYLSQDAVISNELSKLQSVHAQCQLLFDDLDQFRERENVLSKIYSMLAEVNLEENPDIKPLEFISDFELMKERAHNYGHLEGEFLKKNDFILVDEKDNLSAADNIQFLKKEELCDQDMPTVYHSGYASSTNYVNTIPTSKEANDEDSFQIIDLVDNMCCLNTNEDFVMFEDMNSNQTQEELRKALPCELVCESSKACSISKYSYEVNKSNSSPGFNLEEKWKQIELEMNKKFADAREISKPQEENDIKHNVKNDNICHRKISKSNHYKHNKYLFFKGADQWLHNTNEKDEKKFQSVNHVMNIPLSPAELVQKAFKRYLIADSAKNWLSHN